MSPEFHAANRRRLVERLENGLIILQAHTSMQRANDASYPFVQEANFWYLTGINEPDWTLVIDGVDGEWLIAPEVDDMHALFDGSLPNEVASQLSGVRKVISHDDSVTMLRKVAKKHPVVHTIDQPGYAKQYNFNLNPAIRENKARLERIFMNVRDCQKELTGLRAIKQPEEVDSLKKAIKLTVKGFEHVRLRWPSYHHEFEIESDFSHVFRSSGAAGHAYDPIIASGLNACTLHYSANQAKLRANDMVLMDVGASVNGYAADITRTYAGKNPTKRQLAVHDAVADAHKRIIGLLAPNVPIETYHSAVMDIMEQTLVELGLIREGDREGVRRYFPHAISHGLGIDVHDGLGAPRAFEVGMVLTVEPGIYIPEERIGVRIEDDILITEKGHINLSGTLSTGP